jgi:predicted secreted protein
MNGVYPVFDNIFKLGTKGASSVDEDMKTVADMESFSVSLDNGIEEWNPMDTGGWTRRLTTAKSVSISLSGKRNVGDEGNDYVAGLAWVTGQNANSKFEWTLPSGAKVSFNCVVNVTSLGGDSTAVDALEVEIMSDGLVTYTAPSVTE